MPVSQDVSRLYDSFDTPVTTIDSHTEGEVTRLIVGGVGNLPGRDMMAKRRFFQTHYDPVRCLMTKEPRGSRQVLAAMVTDPVSSGADFGLIYMDARRYPLLCGHATIGAVVSLAKTGALRVENGENRVAIDTPSGTMAAVAHVEGGEVISVSVDMVPSFVLSTGHTVRVPGFGPVTVDLVCTGGFFAMVDTDTIHTAPTMENKDFLVDLGMKIIDAANQQLTVTHPLRPEVNTVDVTEFYETKGNRGSGMVVYGESHMDRSPCGTGTAAKLALLRHCGRIGPDEPYVNQSPLGTAFNARIVEKTTIGPVDAYVTRINGRAWITGVHHFFLDSTDPFKEGYLA